MTRQQTLADQRSYLEGGLRRLACDRCGAQVRVRKHSQLQTSVQWSLQAVGECVEFAARQDSGEPSALVATCAKLRDSIDRAVCDGRLDIDGRLDAPTTPGP